MFQTMSLKFTLAGAGALLLLSVLYANTTNSLKKNTAAPSPIDGSWEKVSTVIDGKLTTPKRQPAEFKMWNDGYFSLIHYNDDGTLGFAGAGVFEVNGNHYKETYKYCHDTTFIGASVWFDWYMKGDTLVFTGFKKVILPNGKDVTKDWGGDTWVEKRVRAKRF